MSWERPGREEEGSLGMMVNGERVKGEKEES